MHGLLCIPPTITVRRVAARSAITAGIVLVEIGPGRDRGQREKAKVAVGDTSDAFPPRTAWQHDTDKCR